MHRNVSIPALFRLALITPALHSAAIAYMTVVVLCDNDCAGETSYGTLSYGRGILLWLYVRVRDKMFPCLGGAGAIW